MSHPHLHFYLRFEKCHFTPFWLATPSQQVGLTPMFYTFKLWSLPLFHSFVISLGLTMSSGNAIDAIAQYGTLRCTDSLHSVVAPHKVDISLDASLTWKAALEREYCEAANGTDVDERKLVRCSKCKPRIRMQNAARKIARHTSVDWDSQQKHLDITPPFKNGLSRV